MLTRHNSPWFEISRRVDNPAIRLFCFPYAGGSASIYRDWHEQMPPAVEVIALLYPGRGKRLSETPIASCDEMVAVLVREMRHLSDKPFIFFGHSNGSLVS